MAHRLVPGLEVISALARRAPCTASPAASLSGLLPSTLSGGATCSSDRLLPVVGGKHAAIISNEEQRGVAGVEFSRELLPTGSIAE